MSDEQIRQPAVTSGAYDIIAIIPAGDKGYESAERPGFIEALPSVEYRGCLHPRHKKGRPIFTVLLDKNGSIVKK